MSGDVLDRTTIDGPLTSIVERLAGEMAEAWALGDPVRAEAFLARCPASVDRPQAIVRLVYEEVCLRLERGETVRPSEIASRFPDCAEQLAILLDCHDLIHPAASAPRFPAVGEVLDGFSLAAELGRGAQGCVFLASQPDLADRPVVLKVVPLRSREDQLLARLQHTYIVPIHSSHDFPDRGVRALCMPYLGGSTLHHVLQSLRGVPPGRRTGKDLFDAIERGSGASGVATLRLGRRSASRLTYPRAICWIGACLAEALDYAHERGLLHLDVKPSNILISDDGEPMLLDFHLARGPLEAGSPAPDWLGGTPAFMSPEQAAVLEAAKSGRDVPEAIDGRSDVYSLGLVLYEALAGELPEGDPAGARRRLLRLNPQVTPSLANLVARCLAPDLRDRYPTAGEVAADCRRHLADRRLVGVPDHSLPERWSRWRRRCPQSLGRVVAILAALAAAAFALAPNLSRRADAEASLALGREEVREGDFAPAIRTLRGGLERLDRTPGTESLRAALISHLRLAERGRAAERLHDLADRLRFLHGAEAPDRRSASGLRDAMRATWDARDAILAGPGPGLSAEVEERIRLDLLDLAVLWADLVVRLAPEGQAGSARREALAILADAERAFGPNAVLSRQRLDLLANPGDPPSPASVGDRGAVPRTAWEHYALGRFLLRRGEEGAAASEFERAIEMQPQSPWPRFYLGLCAYRGGRFLDAFHAFDTCVALSPTAPAPMYNRGLSQVALGRHDRARADFARAEALAAAGEHLPGASPAGRSR